MVFYPVTQILHDLQRINFPRTTDQNFIDNLWGKKAKDYTINQYNYLLDLYNKYILVPSCPRQQYSERHYGP